jgi:DNA-binding NarL/FixJ family response regulator
MKVLIIDDQRLFADGIRKLLKDHDPSIATEYAGNVFSANESITSIHPPDLILLDINDKATINSFDLIARLNQLNIDIPVMVISTTDSAIENNASGFITKSCRRETTLNAILSVLNGSMYVRKPKQKLSPETDINDDCRVNSRQQEVLYLLSQGLLNKQIASELDISSNTVKAHLHDLFRRLHVTNRTAAVQHGYKNGLI